MNVMHRAKPDSAPSTIAALPLRQRGRANRVEQKLTFRRSRRENSASISVGLPIVKANEARYKAPIPQDSEQGQRRFMAANNHVEYRPSEDEPFMNERQREYFRHKLLAWKDDILRESKETLEHLQDENNVLPDLVDRASTETDRALELRTRDRQRKLIAKIDAALHRIEEGSYGFCEETGEPISLRRLDARPIATLSIEAQERHERREKVYRDD
jgi:DnaK suppressor protein